MEEIKILAELGSVYGNIRVVNLEVRIQGHKARSAGLIVSERYKGGPMQAATEIIADKLTKLVED